MIGMDEPVVLGEPLNVDYRDLELAAKMEFEAYMVGFSMAQPDQRQLVIDLLDVMDSTEGPLRIPHGEVAMLWLAKHGLISLERDLSPNSLEMLLTAGIIKEYPGSQ